MFYIMCLSLLRLREVGTTDVYSLFYYLSLPLDFSHGLTWFLFFSLLLSINFANIVRIICLINYFDYSIPMSKNIEWLPVSVEGAI